MECHEIRWNSSHQPNKSKGCRRNKYRLSDVLSKFFLRTFLGGCHWQCSLVQVSFFSLGLRLKEETDGKVVEGVYKWSPWYTTILI